MTEPATAGHDCIVAAGTPLHRIHRNRPGAIAWFDTSAHGRFNLTDIPEGGTCCLALDPLGAYIEPSAESSLEAATTSMPDATAPWQ